MLKPELMKKTLQWTVLALLAAGSAQAADVRLGLTSSVGLGCEVAGVRAGLQEGRFGGYLQGSYCTSNVVGQSGGAAFGGGITFDLYQSSTLAAYAQLGASAIPNSNPNIYGGVGVRYGMPLLPVEGYVEGGVSYTSTVISPLIAPRFAVGVNYVWRGLDLSQAGGGESRPSNISAPGTGGLNVDSGSTGGQAAVPATSCNVSPEADAAAATSVARAAAQQALSSAATAYSALYSNVSYEISVGDANVQGNRATVTGTITLNATNRSNGQPVSGTYSGVVTLARSGCGWVATGYRQNGQ